MPPRVENMTDSFIIRPARCEDAEIASELWANMAQQHQAYDSQWWGWAEDAVELWKRGFFLDKPNEVQLIAQQAGKVVGFVRGKIQENPRILTARLRGLIWDVYVLPRSRSMGIEAALIEAIMNEFRRRGAEEVTLPVAWANQPAMELCRKMGLRPAVVMMYRRL